MDTQKKTNKKDYKIYTLFSLLSLVFSNYLVIILLYSAIKSDNLFISVSISLIPYAVNF